QVSLNVRPHPCQCVGAADGWLGFAEQAGVHLRQQIGVVVGLTSEHHTIEALQMSFAFVQSLDASVEDDFQFGEVRLQLLRDVVAQWWDLTILFRREAFENGDSRVYGKAAAAGVSYLADKITQLGIAVATVDADSMLYRHIDFNCITHGFYAIGYQRRMSHQAGADHVVLHSVAGAT